MDAIRRFSNTSLVAISVFTAGALPLPAQRALDTGYAARIDAIFAPYTAAGSPGCAVGVYRDGEVAFARGYGLADLQHGTPITPSTPFTTGSLSKQFTAAAVMWLAREGKLSLDDLVRTHVPELRDAGPVTVRQMIHHTSGLRDFWALVDLSGRRFDDGYRTSDVLELASRQQALNFLPGSEYAYSNTSYILLGLIVERVSGRSLRAFADSVFFKPLGMPVTRFLDDHTELITGRAGAYSPRADGGWQLNVWANDLVGQGGLVTTLEELQRWDENAYSGRVGGAQFVRALEVPGQLANDSLLRYAYGVNVSTWRGQREISHTGSTGGFRSALYRYPDVHTSVALLCNVSTANTTTFAHRVAEAAFGSALTMVPARAATTASVTGAASTGATSTAQAASSASARQAPRVAADSGVSAALTPAQVAAYAGVWYSEELDAEWTLEAQGSRLTLLVPRRTTRVLTPGSSRTLSAGELQLVFDAAATPQEFSASVARVRGIRFVRR